MTQRATIQLKRGAAALWSQKNPILKSGEPGLETDTGNLKLGDGFTPWNDLEYFGLGASGDITAILNAHINSLTPHPVYDDGPSLVLLYENAKAG